ncbi:deoxyribose-phosphate aldolase [Geothermobacter ehrlichii]|uniref:Deoxyribose-phosphate aldolase n=1 Tax=Geothermobacter ehrlichii TaxID=213224 RepID=A0A5D3WJ53_9BACT|nr:deoxyribose-phosphate aldolase [Geothermobacter ehrlichii]TYO98238.1 deoxyribose-phosphate aldolase [Geothermobacter ehrlichii]
MTPLRNPARLIDHTLLRPTASETDIRQLCEEAVEYGFASVCVPPVMVPLAARLLYGSSVATGTVVGFPLGYSSPQVKVFEARQAAGEGATEIDMVIQQGWMAAGEVARVEEEIAAVVRAVPGVAVKVIFECCRLSHRQMEILVGMAIRAGAAYVKTSTGFAEAGASVDHVRLLAASAAGRIGVKAAGGIRTLADLQAMVAAGATRIGTSSACAIMEQWSEEARGA